MFPWHFCKGKIIETKCSNLNVNAGGTGVVVDDE